MGGLQRGATVLSFVCRIFRFDSNMRKAEGNACQDYHVKQHPHCEWICHMNGVIPFICLNENEWIARGKRERCAAEMEWLIKLQEKQKIKVETLRFQYESENKVEHNGKYWRLSK